MSSGHRSQQRRALLKLAGIAVVAAAAPRLASAQARVEESDPQAQALAYRADTTKVDKAKFPKHTPDQKCSNCQLYSGKPGDAAGPCSVFTGKLVAANGWCNVWTKKAG
jgi:hypothetical protein